MLYALTATSAALLHRRPAGPATPLLLPGGGGIAILCLCVWLMTQPDRAAWVSTLWVVGLGYALRRVLDGWC